LTRKDRRRFERDSWAFEKWRFDGTTLKVGVWSSITVWWLFQSFRGRWLIQSFWKEWFERDL
jgi:hypothetical protein